jgi:uncharacterized repeat protein (TIGR01451 family)
MALPGSGTLSFNEIGVELQRASGSILNITTAETGGYVALNPYSTYKPDGVIPSSVSEWYSYNHTQSQLIPFFQITKSAPSDVNVNTNFNFTITVANSGNTSTNGSAVVVTDVMPANMQFVTYNAPGWNVNQFGSTIQATRYDVLTPNNAYQQIVLTVKIVNCAAGAYYNQANVYGGGTSATQYSNTTTTNATTFYATISVTRSIQKNDCGQFCSGSYVNVTSPSFGRGSCNSQAEAIAFATSDANNWLDANGQGVANASGTCNCNPPTYTLTKTLDTANPIYVNGAMQWFIRLIIQNNNTVGTVTISDFVGNHMNVVSHIKPAGWSYYESGGNVNFYTSNTLTVGSTYDFYIIGNANTVGNFTNNVSVGGGGGNATSANASVTILAAVQPSFSNFIETNNANPIFRASSNTFAVHAFDDNIITHSISFTINNASVAPYSLRIGRNHSSHIFLYGGGSNSGQWSWNGTEFTNTVTLSPGNYNVGYANYKVENSPNFLGVETSSHQFILYYNNNQYTNSFTQYNVAGRAKINLRLFCGYFGFNNDWLNFYKLTMAMMNYNGGGNIDYSFQINEVFSKEWFIVTLYPQIGSGIAIGQTERFLATFKITNSDGNVTYRLEGECLTISSNRVGYEWGNPYYYDSTRFIGIDFDPYDGSFITC